MSDARDFTADLLGAGRTRIGKAQKRGPDSALSPEVLFEEVRRSLDQLEALRARDPRAALEAFRALVHDEALLNVDLDSFIEVWRTAIEAPDAFRAWVTIPLLDAGSC